MWLPFYERLAERHDMIVPEHPGFGDTPRPETLRGFDDLVLHYEAFLALLRLERVHLVGHSLGGWIAANLAVFYPRRFKSLTLLTADGVRSAERVAPVRLDTFRLEPQEALDALLNGRGDRYTEYFVQEGPPEDVVHAFEEATARALLCWNPRYDWRLDHRLQRVVAPTLVLGAEEDRIVPNGVARAYARLIPDACLITVEGAPGEPSGHLLHLEHPERVGELVAEHVAANAHD
jgi:pimeloyl-ACP methyl ester carboxylesterase